MALDFGWRTNDVRETIWKGDKALKDVPQAALEAWEADGDASHLRPYQTGGTATVFTFRALTLEEAQYVQGVVMDADAASILRAWVLCFKLAVDFPGSDETGTSPNTGRKFTRSVRERGFRMLSEEFSAGLEQRYPGIVSFYGRLVFGASYPSEPEKKASSLPSIGMPSSAGGNTPADTGAAERTAPPGA